MNRFWEALSGICSRTIQHPESQVNRLCITPDKKFLAAAGRHHVRLYDIKSSNPNVIMNFEGHTNNITGVAFHCEGKWMVTSSEDCTVRVWDTRSGQIQRSYTHDHPVNDVVIHPNQGELVSADRGGVIMIWDLGDNKCTHQLIPEDDVSISSVSIASDGSLLAAGNNKGDVYMWRMFQSQETTTLSPCRVFNAHKTYLTRLLLSPDIKLLATCSADHTVRIWRIDMNEENLELVPELPKQAGSEPIAQYPGGPASPADSTDSVDDGPSFQARQGRSRSSSNLTSSSHPSRPSTSASNAPLDTFKPVNAVIANRHPLPLETILESHQRWVWDCAFSADSAYLVTVCSDHYARLWEVASATIIRQYNGHHRGAVCVALNDYSSQT
ncbi:WD repeat-containing protein wat1 [Cyphellophora attinorum]|uniref:WD repeat-containing protein wat1 n=1 Tax=Cyphellophora attinorum TaxID=1664694 RepID=A0A0N0NQC9_9EURO|nr:WD repeat-containing protein wat1 [Phialophora attinorum]KPI43761.1 WD repeat-containing protein wat1 [Phialophora attinorum]